MAEDDDWVEALLRADPAEPVPDAGFTARLRPNLPPRRHALQAWITPAMTLAGAVLAILTLGGLRAAVGTFPQIEDAGLLPVSIFMVLPLTVVLAGCTWALCESK